MSTTPTPPPPRTTPQQVAAAFLTPPRRATDRTVDFLPGGTRFFADAPRGKIAGARAGGESAPLVLLVHGWGGHSTDMEAFVRPLLDAGFGVAAIDLPAHGESEGNTASIPHTADALLALQRELGELHTVIAHSVGTAAVVHAIGKGLRTERVVLVSAPARYADYAAGFAAQAGLDADQTREMIALLAQMGVDVASVSTPRTAAQLTQRALICHSADDRTVPLRDGQEIAKAWPGARLIQLEGLGHRRILGAPEVVTAIVEFVRAA